MPNGGGESQDLLCTGKSSPTTARRRRNSSCRQNRTMCPIESSCSSKDLVHITDQLSGKKKDSTLPGSIPTDNLPKTQRLRDEPDATSGQPDLSVFCGPSLETFSLVTEQQVKNIVLKAPKKPCMPDPVPTCLMHECLDDLIPTITAIINESLVSGIITPPVKQTGVLPILKEKAQFRQMCLRTMLKNYSLSPTYTSFQRILENAVL